MRPAPVFGDHENVSMLRIVRKAALAALILYISELIFEIDYGNSPAMALNFKLLV